MLKTDEKEEETVEVDGVKYKISSNLITKDDFTGNYFKSEFATEIPTDIIKRRKGQKLRYSFNINDHETYNDWGLVFSVTDVRSIDNIINSEKAIEVSFYSTHNRNERSTILLKDSKEKFIKKHGLVKGIYNPDVYYDRRELKHMDKQKPYRKFDNTYSKKSIDALLAENLGKINTPEIIELSKNITKRNIEMGVDSLTHVILEGNKKTFGVELETCKGRLEEDEVTNLNVKAVHDGSLRDENGETPGGEYVTGILYGDAGFNQLHEICRVLQNNCEINNKCGVHVHIGGLNWNKEEIVLSYLLAETLEKDIFSILPASRRKNEYCRSLTPIVLCNKSYLLNAPNIREYNMKINEFFGLIYDEAYGERGSTGGPNKNVNRNLQHPKGAKCGYDKRAQRYCWLNYITLLFNTKEVPDSHTLEFRPMSATLNFTKVKNWIKICMAFVNFVENNKAIIKAGKYIHTDGKEYPLDLELIIAKSYPKTGGKLIDYIRERRETFKTKDESIDYIDVKSNKKTIKEVVCV